MEKIKTALGPVIITILELLVGIFLFIDPEKLIKFVLAGFGAVLVGTGIVKLLRYLRYKNKEAVVVGSKEDKIDKSALPAIMYMIFGVACFFGYPLLKSIFSAVAIIIGVVLLVAGIIKYIQYDDMKKRGNASSLILGTSLLSLVCGVLCIFNPFGTTNTLFRFAGAAMIFFSVLDLAGIFGLVIKPKKKEEKKEKKG